IHMNWLRTQPQPQRTDFDSFERSSGMLNLPDNEFYLRAHAIVWPAKGELPSYVTHLFGDEAAIRDAVRAHVDSIADRYSRRVRVLEASNEGHSQWAHWGLDH